MVFGGKHGTRLFRIRNQQFRIERLYRKHIDNRSRYVFFCKRVGSLQRLCGHYTAGNEGNVRSFAKHNALSQREFLLIGIYFRGGFPSHAQVFYAVNVLALLQHAFEHGSVRNVENHTAGNAPVQRHIFKGHVSAAVKGCAYARIGADNGYRIAGISARQKDLIETAARCKRPEGMHNRLKTCSR